ncbi:MAG: 2-oxoacid:ferredoxin oxidoreductase subunit beta [Candidatus Aenigmatarchaeota archaeon]
MTDSTLSELTPKELPTWCPGCGDFSILTALKSALAELNISRKDVVTVSGIGCGSKLPHFIRTYGFEGLHGRILPVATGVKLANNDLTVIGIGGDGDAYGIGGNHFFHILRRNIDITYIVQDNAIYGLTKGQTSPTSEQGFKSISTPSGVLEEPVNPILMGIFGGATYVARGYGYDVNHLKKLIINAIKHKGFSIIDVFQPCLTYNKVNTADWYNKRVYKLEDKGHDPTDRTQALAKAQEWGDQIPIGLFYKADKPTYDQGVFQITETPLAKHDIKNIDISEVMEKYR